jgi:hypothetical protein
VPPALRDRAADNWRRGPNDDRAPRRLTPGELSHLLRPFGIVPLRSVFNSGHRRGGSVGLGMSMANGWRGPKRFERTGAHPLTDFGRRERALRQLCRKRAGAPWSGDGQ